MFFWRRTARRLPAQIAAAAAVGAAALVAGCGSSSKQAASASDAASHELATPLAQPAAPLPKRAVLVPRAITSVAGSGVSLTYANGSPYTLAPGKTKGLYVTCPSGMEAVGGGMSSTNTAVVMNDSLPYNSTTHRYGGPADSWLAYATTAAGHSLP